MAKANLRGHFTPSAVALRSVIDPGPACTHPRPTPRWKRRGKASAYFGEARPIFSVEDLASLAGEIGLDPEDAREALLSHRCAGRVTDERREAARLGATGVPFFVIDRRYAVSGAPPADTLLAALQRAWDERLLPGRP